MENSELLNQVLAAMQEQTEVLTKMVDDKIELVRKEVREEVRDAETRINIKIENEVSKKIESLFDGYKLVHEKQWELEHQVTSLTVRLERLEAKVG